MLFELDAEPIATPSDLEAIENQLSVSLPEEYKQFTTTFGGGYFAYTVIYSASMDSQWGIIKQNQLLDLLKEHDFVSISDNQAGDYYGYKIENGRATNSVYVYDHEDRQIRQTKYRNLYEYLMEIGLKQPI